MKTVFEKEPDRSLIDLVFKIEKSAGDLTGISLARFSFSKNYSAEKWRKWFSKLEKSEIRMIMILIFKSKQELFSFAE